MVHNVMWSEFWFSTTYPSCVVPNQVLLSSNVNGYGVRNKRYARRPVISSSPPSSSDEMSRGTAADESIGNQIIPTAPSPITTWHASSSKATPLSRAKALACVRLRLLVTPLPSAPLCIRVRAAWSRRASIGSERHSSRCARGKASHTRSSELLSWYILAVLRNYLLRLRSFHFHQAGLAGYSNM